ncbi:MAG: alpha/beta fold hydrolase [Chthonomonadaceae bacterium]|nr:alpha/beta fold hydrolase [Chthonomonadaceae bacterium]
MNRAARFALLAGAAFAIPAAINLAIAARRRPLEPSLPGDSGEYAWPLGSIAYQVRGEGRPLVLVHGVGAGESSYEWRHNFDALSEHFRVYAIDLPGFGRSARRDIAYTADIYVTALVDFMRDVVQESAYVLASSLSGAYAVKLAALRPELVERLVLLEPTGLERLRRPLPLLSSLAFGAFSVPAYGESIYNGIASRSYIESYLRQNLYVDPARVTPTLVDHYYRTAHQPGGQYALRSFLSGLLCCDITEVYPEIQQPILVVWGRQAKVTPVEDARAFYEQNPNARLRIFENSGMLPHDEEAPAFNAAVTEFLNTATLPPRAPAYFPASDVANDSDASLIAS